jgi:hypothetical protein
MNPDDDPNELYAYLEIDKEAVTGFSIFFSRFEYSLKRTRGYAKPRNNKDNRVEADWAKFARNHNADFEPQKTAQLNRAVEYLLGQPPLQQILKNEVLEWEPTPVRKNVPFLKKLIDSVKTVRNNLFHGGKFISADVLDPGRDKCLIESCMAVLKACLLLDEGVRDVFYRKEN